MKTLSICVCTLFLTINLQAQLNYNFTAFSDTYTTITGGNTATLVADGSGYPGYDDGIANGIPIGFNFIYNDVSYSTINASSNGFASFQTIPVITNTRDNYYNTSDLANGPYSATNTRPVLAPLWDDLDMYSANGLKYITTGSAPNRVFTLEWNDVYFDIGADNIGINFQIKLYEGSNIVEFRYLQKAGAVSATAAASIGITGIPFGTDNFLSLNNASASPSVSSTVETYTINTKPATNQVYQFSPGNLPPVLAAVTNKTVNELSPITFTASATDPNGSSQSLTYSLDNAPDGATIDPLTGVFTWTPTEDQGPNVYNMKVRVTDNGTPAASDEQSLTITVNEINTAPNLAVITNKIVNELTPVTFTAVATDGDLPAQTLSYSLVGEPAGATINSTSGQFNWTPTEAQGPATYTFKVRVTDSDPSAQFSEQSVTIIVNEVNVAPVLAEIPPRTVSELTAVAFTVSATDGDQPTQAITYSLTGAPTGASIDATTGAFSWTPTEAQGPAVFSFVVRATENGSTSLYSEQTVTITVTEVNQSPVLTAISDESVNELSPITFTASATDPDVPTQQLTYTLVGAPAGATIDLISGNFNWTPTEAQGGSSYTFKVRVTDDGTAMMYAEQSMTITVADINLPPVLAPIGNRNVTALSNLTFTVTAIDPDLPSQVLTFSLTGTVPQGANINPNSGAFTWTPTSSQGPGAYTFTIRVTDNGTPVSSASETITVTVAAVPPPPNTAPTLAAIGNKTANELSLLSFTATATDKDVPAQALTYSLAGTIPAGATIGATSGIFNWTPTEAQGPGSYTFKVRVTDNGTSALFAEEQIIITVNEVNAPPVLAAIDSKVVNEQSLLTFTASATDPDVPAQNITYSLVGAPQGAIINATTGVFTWTPSEAQGPNSYTFKVRATDDATSALFSEQTVNVTVNEVNIPPTLTAITSKTVNELATLSFTATASDIDLPAQSITYSLIGAPTGATVNSTTGQFTWTPTEAQGPGSYTFKVRATDSDPSAQFAEQSVTINVNEVNVAPVLAAIPAMTVSELTAVAFTASATDADQPAQTLTYSLIGAPSGTLINAATGAFSWTPTEAQGPAVYSFVVRATESGTAVLYSEQTVSITVTEVNQSPVLATITDKTVNELSPITFTASATDPDLPVQGLTYALVTPPAGATIDPVSGIFNWTPTEAQGGNSYTFKIRVTDDGTPAKSAEQSITINVAETNSSPVLATIGNQNVVALSTLTFTATATDSDVPVQAITYSLTGIVPAGAAINPATGLFTWTPTAAQGAGSYTFGVKATDNGTPALFGSETITVTVAAPPPPSNTAPTLAAIGNKTANELSLLSFTATATDKDVPAQALTYSLVGTIPAGATIGATSGIFNWTPSEAQGPGSYTFKVRVTDNGTSALYAEEQITITVNEVNATPVLAAIDNKVVYEQSLLTFTASATDPDVPAQNITYSLVGAPQGAIINATTGVFTWTPSEAQGPSSYTFKVRATDDATSALFSEQTVNVTVNEVNIPPTLTAITNKTVNELATLSFTATASDIDLPAQSITYSLIGAPAGATVNSTTGQFTWTPTEAQGPGSYTFKVRATDSYPSAQFAEQSVTINVNEVNVAPVLAAIPAMTVSELTAVAFTASATDADQPAQTLTYSLIGAPSGTLINAATGAFSWTPTEAQGPAVYSFVVRATESGTAVLYSEQTVSITVTEVNQSPVLATITDKTVNELSPITFTASATDPDLPVQGLTYALVTPPAGATIDPVSGIFNWTPTEAQGGNSYTFKIRVTDDGTPAKSAEQSITINVAETNSSPVLATIGNQNVVALSTLTFTATATDSDVPVQAITYSLTGIVPAGAAINPATGLFTWTPTAAQGAGSYTFGVKATDNGTPALFGSETITVTVAAPPPPSNTAPTLAAIGNKTANELSLLSFTATATDKDVPAQALTYSLVGTIPAGATIGATSGIFNWTPSEAQGPGSYTFKVRVTDNGTSALYAEEQITITVNELNAPPVLAAIDNKVVNELALLQFTASATDGDVPVQKISYSLVNAPVGATINSTTSVFTWTPTEAQGPANYTFKIRATDDGANSQSAEQTVNVTVIELNTPPVLAAVTSKSVDELSSLNFQVTATDADVPAQTLTYSLSGAPTGATINAATGMVSFTPTEAQGPNTYNFIVRVTDNGPGNLFAEQPVTVVVNEVNTAPVLITVGNKTVNALSTLTFTAKGTDADLPAQSLTYSLTGTVPTGATINSTTGQFTWTPSLAQAMLTYTFGVKVTDNGNPVKSAEEIITVTVTNVMSQNIAPILAPIGNKTVNELSTLTFKATATDRNIPAQTLTFSLRGTVPAGARIDSRTGMFTWTPTEWQGPNTYTFKVRVTDNGTPALFAEEQITIIVNEVIEIGKPVNVKLKINCNPCVTLTAPTHGLRKPFTYVWSNGATTASIKACSTSDATFSVTIKGMYETRKTDFNVTVDTKECKKKKKTKGSDNNNGNNGNHNGHEYGNHYGHQHVPDLSITKKRGATPIVESIVETAIFPNPTSTHRFQVTIKDQNLSDVSADLYVTDILGRKIRALKMKSNVVEIDLQDQPKGLYVVHILKNNKEFTSKVVLQ